MATITYPTQTIVEKCLQSIFPGLNLGCLNLSISVFGNVSENHNQPCQYGYLPVSVTNTTGVDIPIKIVDSLIPQKNKTIAIVARDPLRTKSDLMLKDCDFKFPIVGTPFAYHYNIKRYPKTKVYRDIINKLLCEGYAVYVTDAHKQYPPQKNVEATEISCLEEELKEIKPQLVVTFGTDARDYLEVINNKHKKFNVVSLPHPSQRNWDNWKLFIFSQAWGVTSGVIASPVINWSSYANQFTVINNKFGNPPKKGNKMDTIINKTALDIIQKKLEKMKQ